MIALLGMFNPAHSATLRRVVPGGTMFVPPYLSCTLWLPFGSHILLGNLDILTSLVGVGGGGGAGVGGGVGLVVVSCGVVGGGTMLKVVVGGGTFLVVSLVMVVLVVFLVAVAACLAGVFTLLFNSLLFYFSVFQPCCSFSHFLPFLFQIYFLIY